MLEPKPRIRCIASDWGHVHAEFDNLRAARALHAFSRGQFDAERMARLMFKEGRAFFDGFMRGQFSARQFREIWRILFDLEKCDDKAFDEAFGDVFTLNPEVHARWIQLWILGVRLVSASNMEPIRHARLRAMGVHDVYDFHNLSYEVGAIKPEQTFYQRLLATCGCASGEILFVDDHVEFGQAAERLGMHFAHFDGSMHPFSHLDRQLQRYEFVPFSADAAPPTPA